MAPTDSNSTFLCFWEFITQRPLSLHTLYLHPVLVASFTTNGPLTSMRPLRKTEPNVLHATPFSSIQNVDAGGGAIITYRVVSPFLSRL
jgi:hypothetical protein